MKIYLVLLFVASIGARLRDHAKRIYIGAAISGPSGQLNITEYKQLAAEQFNCVTPIWEMKWNSLEYIRNHPNYSLSDPIVEFAHQHGMKVRGHNLIWHWEVPDYVTALENNKEELRKAMIQHITNEVTHYKGKIYSWDVVNEPLTDDGSLKNATSIWGRVFGISYIVDAFKLVHQIDPGAKLYINEYKSDAINTRSDALYKSVKDLRAQGVPIHGVGLECHFELGKIPKDLKQNMQRFADLGVDVAITELDIRIKLPVQKGQLEQQAKEYSQVYKACLEVDRCVGVTTWGFVDKYSWIPGEFPGYGSAHLWDENYKPKPAVSAVENILY